MRRAALLLLFAPAMIGAASRDDPPAALSASILLAAGGFTGQGIPIGSEMLLSAAHVCAHGHEQIGRNSIYTGVFDVLWVPKDAERDICTLRIGEGGKSMARWLLLSKHDPDPAQRLWWSMKMPNGSMAPVHGSYLGPAGEGNRRLIDGTVWPGTSGSAVLTDDGMVVGVMIATIVPEGESPVRPLAMYESVVGGIK